MIILFFLFILFIGFLNTKSNKSNDYLYASRSLTLPSFVATIVTTWYGGILEIGRFSYEYGIVTWVIFGLYYYISAFIFGTIIGPKIYKNNVKSIPEYFKINYGIVPEKITALIIILISSPAPYLIIFSTIIGNIYDIDYYLSLIIGIIFSTGYIYFGGFKSIIKTDKIQFIFMFLGFIIMIFYLFFTFGGIDFLIENVPKNNLTFTGNLPLGYILSWSLISMVTFIDPNIFQRTYSSNNTATIKKGLLLSIFFWFIFDILTITVGLYASAIIDSNIIDANPYLFLADSILPPTIKIFFYISLLSIVMSTIDSFSFVSAITISNDLFPFTKNILKRTRFGLFITAIISYIIAINFSYAIDVWYIFGSIAASSLLIPFLLLIFDSKKKIKYPTLSLIAPICICIYWIFNNYPFGLDPIYPGILSSSVICYLSLDNK